MNKEIVSTPAAPAAIGPYSQAVKTGLVVFLSGQVGLDPATKELVSDDFEAQVRQAFRNLGAVAKASGGSLANAVKLDAVPDRSGQVRQGQRDHGRTRPAAVPRTLDHRRRQPAQGGAVRGRSDPRALTRTAVPRRAAARSPKGTAAAAARSAARATRSSRASACGATGTSRCTCRCATRTRPARHRSPNSSRARTRWCRAWSSPARSRCADAASSSPACATTMARPWSCASSTSTRRRRASLRRAARCAPSAPSAAGCSGSRWSTLASRSLAPAVALPQHLTPVYPTAAGIAQGWLRARRLGRAVRARHARHARAGRARPPRARAARRRLARPASTATVGRRRRLVGARGTAVAAYPLRRGAGPATVAATGARSAAAAARAAARRRPRPRAG